jgi:hypothetical protein
VRANSASRNKSVEPRTVERSLPAQFPGVRRHQHDTVVVGPSCDELSCDVLTLGLEPVSIGTATASFALSSTPESKTMALLRDMSAGFERQAAGPNARGIVCTCGDLVTSEESGPGS